MSLIAAVVEWHALAAKIREIYPELAEDDEALLTSLEGELDLSEKLARLIRSAEDDRTMAAALKIRIAEMEERMKRIETRQERKRDLATKAMTDCGIKRVDQSDFTATLANGQASVVITNEDELPAHLLVQPPPKPDKLAIKGLLKTGIHVPGALLSNPAPHLTVRRT